jgi:hypothetical protein
MTAKGGGRTTPCGAVERAGRLRKAEQFYELAIMVADLYESDLDDVADAFVTLCVHAGIAAADVICCAALGVHAHGDSHVGAIELLGSVDKSAAKHLATLLGLKTSAGYSATPTSRVKQRQAERAVTALMGTARRRA